MRKQAQRGQDTCPRPPSVRASPHPSRCALPKALPVDPSVVPSFLPSLRLQESLSHREMRANQADGSPPEVGWPLPAGVSLSLWGPSRACTGRGPHHAHTRGAVPEDGQPSWSSGWNPGHSTLWEKQAPSETEKPFVQGAGREGGRRGRCYSPPKAK